MDIARATNEQIDSPLLDLGRYKYVDILERKYKNYI